MNKLLASAVLALGLAGPAHASSLSEPSTHALIVIGLICIAAILHIKNRK